MSGPITQEDGFFYLSYKIHDFCAEIASNNDIRVVIVTDAVEGTFSLHEDLIRSKKLASLTDPISKIDQPVIAAITGIKKGLMPMDGGTQRLPRLIGKGKALEIILTGKNLDAREAYRIGLVNKITSREGVMEAAMEMAREMAAKGPIALRYVKEAITKGMDMTLEQGIRLEADLYLLIHTTKDRSEGIKAFQGKKKVEFKGE
jgi:enoyl-CoA hydratase/carnithine racemase